MPKREKTPSPGPDEPKYLSIYNPFPPHSTLEEEVNVKECARWIACFVGQENLYALFFKPSSPNVIIAEINNELTDRKMRDVLGKHDWSEVFVRREDEEVTCSLVFYATFRSRREVEKTGWRTVEITDDIFKGFNPTNGKKIRYPYPETTYCEPPSLAGEVNALRLFRFLPVSIFPEGARKNVATPVAEPSKPIVRVVPGSAAAAGLSPTQKKDLGGKGKKGKKNGSGQDPTIRPTAPLTRSIESSSKAKATFRQPPPVEARMYHEDSDDDAANYIEAHPGPNRPAGWNREFEDEKVKEEDKQKEEEPEKTMDQLYENDDDEDDYYGAMEEVTTKYAGLKIKEKEICEIHGKRCPSGICEAAKEKKRKQKRIAQKNTDTTGQWIRQW